MKSSPLMDFSNQDSYLTRSLLFICEKNAIKLPQFPKRDQIIQAIHTQQQINDIKIREIEAQKQKKSPFIVKKQEFSTPIIPLNLKSASEDSFPTPIVMSRRVKSEMPDGSNFVLNPIPSNMHISPRSPQNIQGNPKSNSQEFTIIMSLGIILLIILFIFFLFVL